MVKIARSAIVVVLAVTERHHSELTGSYINTNKYRNNLCKVCTTSADCAAQVSHSIYIEIKQTYPLAKSPGRRGKRHSTRIWKKHSKDIIVESTSV